MLKACGMLALQIHHLPVLSRGEKEGKKHLGTLRNNGSKGLQIEDYCKRNTSTCFALMILLMDKILHHQG